MDQNRIACLDSWQMSAIRQKQTAACNYHQYVLPIVHCRTPRGPAIVTVVVLLCGHIAKETGSGSVCKYIFSFITGICKDVSKLQTFAGGAVYGSDMNYGDVDRCVDTR